jgi:hypothetical protein
MNNWEMFGVVLGALVWAIGAFTTMADLLENGLSLRDYRKKYGKDLGLLVCTWYRSLAIVIWPVMGLGGFFVGIVRDTIKLFFGKPTEDTKVSE